MSSHEQKQFIDALTRRLAGVDSEKMLVKYWIYTPWIIAFLESL
jgi:hypothetical protein